MPQAVVVGSGPGGASIAWVLANAGVKVLVLEAGPRYWPREDYRLKQPDWEQYHFPEKVPSGDRQTYAPMQELDARWDDLRSSNHLSGELFTGKRRHVSGYRHMLGVGGTTLEYAGESHRLNPLNMHMHRHFAVGADWPFDYGELERFYVQAERAIGVAGPANDPTRPRSAPYPMPAHGLSYGAQHIAQGFRKLGLSVLNNPVAINSQPYDRRPACNYCGQCPRGCPRLDKGSADVTLMRKAEATGNCTVLSSSPVLRLEAGDNDRVKAAVYVESGGQMKRVEADLFVIACGAVETPRLLLNSANNHAPDGLANESGLVGRNFMEACIPNRWAATAACHLKQSAGTSMRPTACRTSWVARAFPR